jgi:xanthine dehydrogenase YagS FAD-binding subunit
MKRFDYIRATTVSDAVAALAAVPGARALAGGTNLVDLMKYDVAQPPRVVDINRLPLANIEDTADGGLRIGALVPNSDLAWDSRVEARYPLLASAILAGASPQLRNAATTGGNLMQRTRCYYFYDRSTPCNKRQPGSGCGAMKGINRINAILGTSDACIATHPSDMCVALAALDAVVHVEGPAGRRVIAFENFHRLPGDTPQFDNTLAEDELIIAVELPEGRGGSNYTYLKLRDRLSYAFALVSVAACFDLDGDRIAGAAIAMGGVAHKPWRDREAEQDLVGKTIGRDAFEAFAQRFLAEARGHGDNDFKADLARRALVRALSQAAHGTPQSQTDKRIA